MKNFLKWTGFVLGGILIFLAIAAVVAYTVSNGKIGTTYDVAARPIPIPTDSASIEHGRHLSIIMGCAECHGENFSGQLMIDAPPLIVLHAPNLTAGAGGAQTRYDDAGLVRAIRHGISSDGRSLLVMPSPDYYHFSDADIGAVVAWLKEAKPVDNVTPPPSYGPVLRVLLATNRIPGFLVAADIDHDAPRPPAPAPGATVEYGAYLAPLCSGCHGDNYAGTTEPGPDGSPPARNITPVGAIGNWALHEFIAAMRTGTTPSGYELDPQFMPWPVIAQMTDQELEAVYLYLRSLPPAIAS